MGSVLRRVLSVAMVTAVTALGVYGAVHLGRGLLTTQASAASTAGSLVCPATGCTASSCHATDASAPGPGSSSGGGEDGSGSAGSSGALVCPATGCAATSCHASAGSGGGLQRGLGGRHSRGDGSGTPPEQLPGGADGQTTTPGGDAANGSYPSLL